MNFLKRSWLYITRKKLKSLIILTILFILSLTLLSSLVIKKSTDLEAKNISKALRLGFTLGNNQRTNPGTDRGSGTVSSSMIDQIVESKDISDYVKRMNSTVDFINTKLVPLSNGKSGYDKEKDKKFGNATTILGVNKSELENKFRSNAVKLTAGRHIDEKDQNKILVHEDFAKKNNLKLGSKIKLKANPYDSDNRYKSTEEAELEIVGLFNGKNPKTASYQMELFENLFFADLTSVRKLNKTTKANEIYQDATFFTDKDIDKTIEDLKKLPLDWKKYELTKNSQNLTNVTATVKNIYSLIDGMLLASFFFGITIIALILYLWINERKHETGILLSIGKTKKDILLQHIFEIIILASVGIAGSYFMVKPIAQNVGNNIVQNAAKSTEKSASASLKGLSLGADADSVTSSKNLDKINIFLEPTDILGVIGLEIIIILIATTISSKKIIDKSPKELLTEVK
ncbi:ABC transporter permease [uncultured Campylobacter sp.]|uniref:ABC transporter permease n=1 Tax=uncultured Campylobacter sp. TaxID=218934 RepID=UPI002628C4BB|nr:ABC transporter permease [uncultured Campylobacter sp.]